MAGEIIRTGDPTSHGGRVIEGSLADICHGKPIAYMGHKTYCPQCKGYFPIIDGAPTTMFYGKGVALAGMKTACGAVLIATQLTDIVEGGSGSGSGDSASKERIQPVPAVPSSSRSGQSSPLADDADDAELEQYFLAVDATGMPVKLIYRINDGDTKLTESALPSNGATVAFPVGIDVQLVYWKAPS
ncbi:MAG: motif family protein [Herminiimonas sp.]|nr:motif family protein [Herminiimonas sp.]